jgi:hypothetical protein
VTLPRTSKAHFGAHDVKAFLATSRPMHFRLFNANNAAFLGVTIGFGVVALAMVLGFYGEWRDPDCQVYPVQTLPSPSGARSAVHEQEACGSTDKLRTTVVVRSATPAGSSTTLVFSSLTGSALGIMSVGQRSLPLLLRWNGDGELIVGYPAAVTPEPPAGSPAGLRVVFEAMTTPR